MISQMGNNEMAESATVMNKNQNEKPGTIFERNSIPGVNTTYLN